MKLFVPLLLSAVAAVLGYVAWTAQAQSYVPPADLERPEDIPYRLEGAPPAGFELRGVAVEGMCCEGCAGKLYRRVMGLAGVRGAAIDPILGRAEALVPADFDVARLEAALTFDKYTAVREAVGAGL